jgi:mono/diheme cytochrome c family protein
MKPLLVYALLSAAGLSWCVSAFSAQNEASPTLVKRGEYLAIAGDCSACHRNPADNNPYSGGFAIESPMGLIYGSNITPSTKFGIGNYRFEDFKAVMREGRAPGGHYLYPAMPYTSFSGMSDDDLLALYSWLMLGVAPDDHPVPETRLPFPFSFRPVMAFWNALFLDNSPVTGGDAAPGSVERGEYLVKTLTHCSTCHTPRNGIMGEENDRFLSGGKVGSWTAPNITPDPQAGIGNWSEADLVTYLRSGVLHGKAVAGGEMGTAAQNSFSQMQESDLRAIARYIRQIPAISGPPRHRSGNDRPVAVLADVETGIHHGLNGYLSRDEMTGARLYNGACASCHASDGRGTGDGFYPPLAGSSAVTSPDPSNLIMTMAEGIDRHTAAGHAFMPEFKTQLTTEELARLASYVSQTFGGTATTITPEVVEQTLKGEGGGSWLIRYASALSWAGIGVVILLGLWGTIAWRRRHRK